MSDEPIRDFSGRYRYLSNFFAPHFIHYNGTVAKSAEHAYQAAKTLNPLQRKMVLSAPTPRQAKFLGQKIDLRPDWEEVKIYVMRAILTMKFQDPSLRERLLFTGKRELIEGNTWHDQFWGDCECEEHEDIPGENWLGKLLMEVRDNIRTEQRKGIQDA